MSLVYVFADIGSDVSEAITPLISLIWSLFPLILIISIIGMVINMIGRKMNRKAWAVAVIKIKKNLYNRRFWIKIIPALFFLGLVLLNGPTSAIATATLTPSSNSVTQGTPVSFELAGATASYVYSVYLNNVFQFNITTNSNGGATFTLTLSETGTNTVQVRNGSTVVASCTVQVKSLYDVALGPYLGLIIGAIVVVLVLSAVFGVLDKLMRVFRF